MSLLPGAPRYGTGQRPPPYSGRQIQGRDVALTVAILLGAYIVARIVITTIFGNAPPANASETRIQLLFLLSMSFLILFGTVYAVLIKAKGYSWADLGVRPMSPHWRRVAMLAGILSVPLSILIVSIVQRQTGADGQALVKALAGSGASFLTALTFFLYIALLVPIAEELVFRGVLFGWLRQSQGFLVTNLICSSAFALLHIQFIAVVVTFFVGFALGWLRERSGSVLAPIIMHQAYNGITLILTLGVAAMPNQAA